MPMPVAAVLAKALRKHAFLEGALLGGAIGGTVGASRDLDDGETRGDSVMRSAGTGVATGLGVTLGALAGAALGAGVGGATGAGVGALTSPANAKADGAVPGGIAGVGLGALAGGALGGVGGGVLAYQLAKRRPKEKTASAILVTLLEKNASGDPMLAAQQAAAEAAAKAPPKPAPEVHTKPEGAVKPLRQASALGFAKARPFSTAALLTAAVGGGYAGGKALIGDSLAAEVDRQGGHPIVQTLSNAMGTPGSAWERIKDPFKNTLGTDPNSQPAPPPVKPGMLDQYWKNLKSGDPATVAGTGAAALLAAVLTHNLLKKRSKR